jgi:hypothetical protein
MVDEPQPPQSTPQPTVLPSPPETFTFPTQLLEQWMAIPSNERLTVDLTRQDFDHLLFGLLRSADATAKLQFVLVDWSHGKVQQANEKLIEFQRLHVDGVNNIRQFFTAVMISAIARRGNVR